MKHCGLLGQKLSHSYSPTIHAALGCDYSYELFEVEPENLAEFMEQGNFHGLNVTIPYKKDVIPFCETLSETARAIGSVNTIVRQADGTLHGDNTDAQGFLAMLRSSDIDVSGKKVLVLGSGGSSLTVRYVLECEGAREIVVMSRGGEWTYENLGVHFDVEIIVNTTPVGMYPNTGESLIELGSFTCLEGVLDIVYNPARTKLLMDAESRGILHIGGLTMLVGQARGSAEIFSGKKIDAAKETEVLKLLRSSMENIVLIGMPGSGKSTISKLLAERLGRPFYDADVELEKTSGKTILEIFEREGEGAFRAKETETLRELGKKSGAIIATGGGCVTRTENYAHLHQNATIVFIERDPSKLVRNGRPLSQNVDLGKMYAKRLPLYLQFADEIVGNDGTLEEVVEAILSIAR